MDNISNWVKNIIFVLVFIVTGIMLVRGTPIPNYLYVIDLGILAALGVPVVQTAMAKAKANKAIVGYAYYPEPVPPKLLSWAALEATDYQLAYQMQLLGNAQQDPDMTELATMQQKADDNAQAVKTMAIEPEVVNYIARYPQDGVLDEGPFAVLPLPMQNPPGTRAGGYPMWPPYPSSKEAYELRQQFGLTSYFDAQWQPTPPPPIPIPVLTLTLVPGADSITQLAHDQADVNKWSGV